MSKTPKIEALLLDVASSPGGAVGGLSLPESLSGPMRMVSSSLAALLEDPVQLDPEQKEALLSCLQDRFESNPERNKAWSWPQLKAALEADPGSILSLYLMEIAGHKPNVIEEGPKDYWFATCSLDVPLSTRSTVYDSEAEAWRREHRNYFPLEGNALDSAQAFGTELLTESDYRTLQSLGSFDDFTRTWLQAKESTQPGEASIGGRDGSVFIRENFPTRNAHRDLGFRLKRVVPKPASDA